MFGFESSQVHLFETSTSPHVSGDNMDTILSFENEFMSSDFFDTIKLVESGVDDSLIDSNELPSSHNDDDICGNNNISESEKSCSTSDVSVSPTRSSDTAEDSLLEFLEWSPVGEETPNNMLPIIVDNYSGVFPSSEIKIIKDCTTTSVKRNGKIYKIQPLAKNDKIILPCGLKNVKILNPIETKKDHHNHNNSRNVMKNGQIYHHRQDLSNTNELSEIKLTNEEKRLLEKEGIQLPAHHPLTKTEDRELKRIRRKIRNKISAQDSRKRKKEYVDGLEDRVRRSSEENHNLLQRIKELQKKNKSLRAHINKLNSIIFNTSTSSSNAAPSTCLMIIILSVLLVSLPNFSQMKFNTDDAQEQVAISRSLLSTQKIEDDVGKFEDFTMLNNKNIEGIIDIENKTEEEILQLLAHFEAAAPKDEGNNIIETMVNWLKLNMFNVKKKQQFFNSQGFIEPNIDDCDDDLGEPPNKKTCFYHQNNIVTLDSEHSSEIE